MAPSTDGESYGLLCKADPSEGHGERSSAMYLPRQKRPRSGIPSSKEKGKEPKSKDQKTEPSGGTTFFKTVSHI